MICVLNRRQRVRSMRWQASLLQAAQCASAALPDTAFAASTLACRDTVLRQQSQHLKSALNALSALSGGHSQPGPNGRLAPPLLPQPLPSLGNFRPQRQFFNLPGSGSSDISKHYRERRLIGYSPEQLYQVVSKVEDYKEFVPWCERSTVIQRPDESYMEAELEVGFKVFVERYTSQVHLSKNKLVLTKVADSTLFNELDNRWEFEAGPTANSCWLTFSIDFAFKSPLYGQLATVFFKEVVQRMMGAFEGRCKTKYGASSFNPKAGFQRTKPVPA